MKIGIIVNNLDTTGGYQKLILRTSQELLNLRHEIIVYTLSVNKEKCYPETIKNINIVSLKEGNSRNSQSIISKAIKLFFLSIINIYKMKSLSKLIDKDLDAMILQDEISLHVLKSYQSNVKTFKVAWMLNNQLSTDFVSTKKWISLYFNSCKNSRSAIIKGISFLSEFVNHLMIRNRLPFVDVFAVYDSFNKNLIETQLNRHADLVYAGADLQLFEDMAMNRSFKAKETYNILSVGVFFPHRRYEDLLVAIPLLLKKNIPVNLTIIGSTSKSPDYYNSLITLKNKLGIDSYVNFIDYVSDEEMISTYKSSDIFVFVNDGFTWGISIFEAIAAGLPVVITNNIGAADIILNKQHGWVVNPCSPNEIANAIEQIIKLPEETNKICKESQQKIKDLLTWKSYTERMLALIS